MNITSVLSLTHVATPTKLAAISINISSYILKVINRYKNGNYCANYYSDTQTSKAGRKEQEETSSRTSNTGVWPPRGRVSGV